MLAKKLNPSNTKVEETPLPAAGTEASSENSAPDSET